MTFFQRILYGALQGVTELLPISSSGHLILFSDHLDLEPNVVTLVFLHIASALALIIVFRKELLELIKYKKLYYLKSLLIASIPVILAGILLGDFIESRLYNSTFVAVNLILWGVVMIITEYGQEQNNQSPTGENALLIGVMQVLSLLPGTSRSGVTTIAGIWSGLSKKASLAFTFIMGIVLLFGAFSYEIIKEYDTLDLRELDLVAFSSAFLFSLLAGSLLKKFSKEKFLTISGIYRIILGGVILVMVL